jgi:hypothetical protein
VPQVVKWSLHKEAVSRGQAHRSPDRGHTKAPLCDGARRGPEQEAANLRRMEWVNVVGLACDLIGAGVLAWGLFIDEDEALKLGSPYWVNGTPEGRAQDLKIPPVQDRLRQSHRAKVGLFILGVGIVLQIVANWPN